MFYASVRHILFAVLLFVSLGDAFAQKEASVWYFGNGAALDFITPAPTILNNSAMNTLEGSASISNSSGRLMFYTNGTTVWNSEHKVMEGSDVLGDPSSTQSAIILPNPVNPSRYYMFTVDNEGQRNGLQYHVINMVQNNGLGRITNRNTMLAPSAVEKLALVRHADRASFWLLAHGWDNNDFYAYHVTGISVSTTAIVSSVGSSHAKTPTDLNSLGAMKVSLDGRRIAVAIYEMGAIEIFDFDPSSGRVSETTPPLSLVSPAFAGCYGIEFSPDGRKLYTTIQSTGDVHQFDLELGTSEDIVNNAVVVARGSMEIPVGSLQLGPDGRIYCARMGSRSLDVIARPNEAGTHCDYRTEEISLGQGRSTLGLPLFYNGFLNMRFVYINTCPGDSTLFWIPDTTGITSVSWDFGEPSNTTANISTEISPKHVFKNSGSYSVKLTILRGSVVESVEQEVVIHAVPSTPLPADTTVCFGKTALLRAERPAYIQYEWSTGETAPMINVDKPGVYWVRVSDKFCTIADTVTVRFTPDWQLTTTVDTTICRGTAVRLNAEGGTTYEWTPAKGLDDPASSSPLARPDETTTYTVTAKDGYGCTRVHSVTVTVIPLPPVGLGNDTTVCADVAVTLDAGEHTPGARYQWSTGEATRTITALSPGDYWVVVREDNCEATDTIHVAHKALPIVVVTADTSICRGDSVELRATGASVYQWFAGQEPLAPTEQNPIVSPDRTTVYTVLATGSNGCTTTRTVTVEVLNTSVVTVSIPSISATVGDRGVRIPIVLSATEPLSLPPLTFTLAFNASCLLPTGLTAGSMNEQTTGASGLIRITLPRVELSATPQTYAELTGDILMGSSPTTPLAIQAPTRLECISVEPQSSVLAIQGCRLDERAVTFAGATSLAIQPNPAVDYTEMRVSSASDVLCGVSIYSLQGQRVWHRQFTINAGSTEAFPLETNALAPGLYRVVLTAGPDIAVTTLLVQP